MAMCTVVHKTGMDLVEFRLKNLLKPGLPTCTGMSMRNMPLGLVCEDVRNQLIQFYSKY